MTEVVFSQIHLPQPLRLEQVELLLERLVLDDLANDLVFETRADSDGIRHFLGARTSQIHHVRHMISQLAPGAVVTGLEGYVRIPLDSAGRVTATPGTLPLASSDPARITRAIYSSLSRKLQPNEALALQVTIGVGRGPAIVPRTIADPTGSWIWQALTGAHAETEIRNRIRDRASNVSVHATMRIAVSAVSKERRKHLAEDVGRSLRSAESAGVSIGIARENASVFNNPRHARHNLRLTVGDLTALIGWPIGHEPLPGMPPAHPRTIRPAVAVDTKSRLFAKSTTPGDSRNIGLAANDALMHTLVIGPTGSGKTNALYHLIQADIEAGHGVAVLDPKDQMLEHIEARIPESRWADVVHIDPGGSNVIGFNPLDVGDRDPDVVADSILAVFAKTFADSWGPRTADIFSASLRTLARVGTDEEPRTLVDLPTIWTDGTYRKKQLALLDEDPGLIGFWNAYDSLSPSAQANWIASPMNKLRAILLRPAAVKVLGQASPRFRLRDSFRDKKIVLVGLNEGLVGPLTAELIGSLIIAELWQATQERAREKGAAKNPGFVYVDEADRFMHLPISLGDALARSRSLSVGWTLAVQYWEQLPREMRSAVKSNARSKIVFRLSSDDDARTFAKLAPGLSDEDFMSLKKYEIYADLVSKGINTGWGSAKTLPPSAATTSASKVVCISLKNYGSSRPKTVIPAGEPAQESGLPAVTSSTEDLGRRRRQ